MPDIMQIKKLEEQFRALSREELVWIHGFVSGLLTENNQPAREETVTASSRKITFAYGTESGHSKKLASDFTARAKQHGFSARLVGLDQYRLNDLQKEEYFLTIVSTQGEGEPPASAKKFYDHIHNNGFQLERLNYSVLALGDTSYPLFCKAGEDVDRQLQHLGGKRIIPLHKCDTDYHSTAESWFSQVMHQLGGPATQAIPEIQPRKISSGKKIFKGTVLSNINLNDRGSEKQTFHIELEADEVSYLPGDSIGVIPENAESVVTSILSLAGIQPDEKFFYRDVEHSAFALLQEKLEVSWLSLRVINKYAVLTGQEIPDTRMSLEELMKIYPLMDSSQFVKMLDILEPIIPRLYSISSSPAAHSGEVHLTVARNKFQCDNGIKYGLCSDFLSRFKVGRTIDFYIHSNSLFRLPENDRDVIMIGPGTGVAPFRSFLYERDAFGASGRNWLFFGDQHFVTDFLYQTEIQQWFDSGLLNRVDLAFSRDQKDKIYVQHKILKHGRQFYEWLENDAVVYICGSRDPMSRDVEIAILEVIKEYGNQSDEEAIEYLNSMKEEGRFLADVY